ncbi:purine-nucleoside phosphorylase [Treponema sp. OMZ 906]|uniref:purine-nucleoside phosphorylase n=1 Tax=Treponema sp. OMZ 906 TaxID=2563662 RepID=UPI0020A37845|nr:purine-nucleoside phosphorylase [Treponema sp. OMZ 906]UTC55416.1 purine-nucleoside phosphorylase [Treponema sp. OMZ 906]
MTAEEKLIQCFKNIKDHIPYPPKIALVLGSGLGDLANELEVDATIPYASIRNFPLSTAPGHRGAFVFAKIGEIPIVIMQGRIHYYEGYPMTDVVLPIRIMKMMGAEILFLTNAAGGANKNFSAGNFMLITDHITCLVPSPLIGKNFETLGVRFPDMTQVYDRDLRIHIKAAADALHIPLKEGVYCQFTGPAYETPQEVRLAGMLGADAVGMSTAVEAVAARHAGMRVCGVSFISNLAAGMSSSLLSEREVLDAGEKAAPLFKRLVLNSIGRIGKA